MSSKHDSPLKGEPGSFGEITDSRAGLSLEQLIVPEGKAVLKHYWAQELAFEVAHMAEFGKMLASKRAMMAMDIITLNRTILNVRYSAGHVWTLERSRCHEEQKEAIGLF